MPQDSFSAQVSAWVAATKQRSEAVLKESTQRIIEVMQTPVAGGGNMPVDTGFLRASLSATLGDPGFSVTYNPSATGKYTYDSEAASLVINTAHLGDKISAVYTANYAIFVEYGAGNRPARRFVGLAAQQWARIVSEVAAEAQARTGG